MKLALRSLLPSIKFGDWRLLLRWLHYLKPFRKALVGAAVLLLAGTGLQLATPLLTGVIIDRVLLEKRAELLHWIVLLLVVVTFTYLGSRLLRSYVLIKMKVRMAIAMHQDLIEHLGRLSFTYSSKRQSGYLASRVMDDPNTVYEFMTGNILTVLQNAVTCLVALAIMMWLSWQTALLSLLILPLYLTVGSVFVDRLRELSLRATESSAQLSRVLFETLSGMYTINTCGAERQMMRRFFARQKDLVRAQVAQFLVGAKVSFLRNFIAALGPLVVLWYGGLAVIRGDLTIGELVAFSAIFGYLFHSAQSLSATQLSLQKVLVALQRIFEILDTPPAIDVCTDARLPETPAQGIELRGVTFSYDGRKNALEAVDLLIPKGKVVALVGHSGAGKSTVAHLLMRFYDPQEGRILIDGTDLRRFSLSALRQWIALVPQDVFLFSTSVEDNIRLGRSGASRFDVMQAARLANADEFIKELPEGYGTLLGEQGLSLSGGQRQRIAIARALLREPQLLILDEAASAVDGAAEKAICETVRSLNTERDITAIVIAHRLSTILQSDFMHLIENGRVIATGDHPTLLATCPEYERLIRFQYGWSHEDPVHRSPAIAGV